MQQLLLLCVGFAMYRGTGGSSPPLVIHELEEDVQTALPIRFENVRNEGAVEILAESVLKRNPLGDGVKAIKKLIGENDVHTTIQRFVGKPDVQILPMPIAVGEPNPNVAEMPIDFSLDGYFYKGAKKIASYRIDFRGVHFKKDADDQIIDEIKVTKGPVVDEDERAATTTELIGTIAGEERTTRDEHAIDGNTDAPVTSSGAVSTDAVNDETKSTAGIDLEIVGSTTKGSEPEGSAGVSTDAFVVIDEATSTAGVDDRTPLIEDSSLLRTDSTTRNEQDGSVPTAEAGPDQATSEKTSTDVDVLEQTKKDGPSASTDAAPVNTEDAKSTAGEVEHTTAKAEPVASTDAAPEGTESKSSTAAEAVDQTTAKEEPAPTTGTADSDEKTSTEREIVDPTVKISTGTVADGPVPTTGAGPAPDAAYTGVPPKPEFGPGKCTVALVFVFDEKSARCLANSTKVCTEEQWEAVKEKSFGACMKAAPKIPPTDNNVKSDCGLGKIYAQVPGEPSALLYGRRCADAFCPKEGTCVQEKTAAHCCILPRWAHYG